LILTSPIYPTTKASAPTASNPHTAQSLFTTPAAPVASAGRLVVGVALCEILLLPLVLLKLPVELTPPVALLVVLSLALVSVGSALASIEETPPVPATSIVLPSVLVVSTNVEFAATTVPPAVSVLLSMTNCVSEFAVNVVLSRVTTRGAAAAGAVVVGCGTAAPVCDCTETTGGTASVEVPPTITFVPCGSMTSSVPPVTVVWPFWSVLVEPPIVMVALGSRVCVPIMRAVVGC
jgi:hypothetical protein